MKDRERQCSYYVCEGQCMKGREGTFRNACQTCNKYVAKPGCKPARADNRQQKLDRIRRKEKWD